MIRRLILRKVNKYTEAQLHSQAGNHCIDARGAPESEDWAHRESMCVPVHLQSTLEREFDCSFVLFILQTHVTELAVSYCPIPNDVPYLASIYSIIWSNRFLCQS